MGLEVGPLGAEACGGLGCVGFDVGQIGGGAWQAVGYLMFVAGLGAGLLGLGAAWSAWTRRPIGTGRFDLNKIVQTYVRVADHEARDRTLHGSGGKATSAAPLPWYTRGA